MKFFTHFGANFYRASFGVTLIFDPDDREYACARCGKPSHHQWNICSDGNRYRGLCAKCDVALNRLVLRFIRDPNIDAKMAAYRARAAA